MFKNLLIVLSSLTLLACSGGNNPDRELQQKAADNKQVISGIAYDVIEKSDLTFDGVKASGSGKILALTSINNPKGSAFKIALNLEDNGEVILHTYSDNKLKNGFDISIARQGGKIKFTLISSGKTIDYSELEGIAAINAVETIELSMDVHNNESPAHFILWKSSESTFDENTALLNSADEPQATPGKGSGLFFGLTLKGASILGLTNRKSYVSH
jgi:hypothetical protein